MRWSDGSYLEDQDHWWLSGIHRDVYLLAKPLEHVSDFFVTTPLEIDADSGALTGARCAQTSLEQQPGSVQCYLNYANVQELFSIYGLSCHLKV
jgi:beta-galactosidase/beta-glucuronidase